MNIPQVLTLIALAGVVVLVALTIKYTKQASQSWAEAEANHQVAAAYWKTSRAWSELTTAIYSGASPEVLAELRAHAERLKSEAQALRAQTKQRFPETTDARSTT